MQRLGLITRMMKLIEPSYIVPGNRLLREGPVDVLFFGESPGKTEHKHGRAFVGDAGGILRDIIKEELPNKRIALDNVCPEWLNYAKPDKDKLAEYKEYREKSIRRHKPKLIVLLGEHAMKAFGIRTKPVASSGKVLTIGEHTVVCSVHPAYILRNPKDVGKIQLAFESIKVCLKGKGGRFKRLDGRKEILKFLTKNSFELCAFDIETDSLDYRTGKILCCSVATKKETVWFPLYHQDNKVWGASKGILTDWWRDGPRVCHHLKFELGWMRSIGGQDPKELYDTMLQAWILDENVPTNLNHQVIHVLGGKPYWLDLPKKQCGYADVPLDTLGPYNARDSWYTFKLHTLQRKQMSQDQMYLTDQLLIPLSQTLCTVEANGIKVDRAKLKSLTTACRKKATRLGNRFDKDFPGVNPRSSKQLRKLLYEDLGLPKIALTPKKAAKTDSDTVEKLSKQEPRIKDLAELKKTESLLSRMLEPWPEMLDDKSLIHTNFGLGNVVTGRLSSSGPNFQNIAREGVERKVMRSRFRGGKIVQLDYNQHELRVLAAVACEDNMLQAFLEGKDIHNHTLIELKKFMKRVDRVGAKAANFSAVYGGTERGLYQKYEIPESEGKKLLQYWYKSYPAIKILHDVYEESIRKHGYVESIFGWRRHLPKNANKHEIRQGYNQPIQNAAAVITYLAMIEINRMLREKKMRSVMILNVHDSIGFDCPNPEVRSLSSRAKKIMLNVDYMRFTGNRLKRKIPLAVDVKVGEHL